MYTALRATSKTLVTFLEKRFQSDPVLASSFTPGGTMQVSLNIPEDMTDRGDEGLSVWLY